MNPPVRLVSVTPDAEKVMAYCARVSNPLNQTQPDLARLLRYCVRHGHWSVFEQANMVLEISTSRAIAPQILRHRSFSFQEFSQRYAAVGDVVFAEARRQDEKNRQNSVDDLDHGTRAWFRAAQEEIWSLAQKRYRTALEKGIAKECARSMLPLGSATRLYMNGTVRSWIHYIQLRTSNGTQLEHARIAEEARAIFLACFPVTAAALEWQTNSPTHGQIGDQLKF